MKHTNNLSYLWPCVGQSDDVVEAVCDVSVETARQVPRLTDEVVVHASEIMGHLACNLIAV